MIQEIRVMLGQPLLHIVEFLQRYESNYSDKGKADEFGGVEKTEDKFRCKNLKNQAFHSKNDCSKRKEATKQ